MLLETEGSPLERLLAAHGAPGMPPLVMPGCWDAMSGMMVSQAGYQAACVGRGAVAGAMLGRAEPDLATAGMMLSATAAIYDATGLSLCVDAGDGFGNAFNVGRTAITMRTAGAEAVQLADDLLPGREAQDKRLTANMIGKLKALIDAAPELLLIARTTRLPGESLSALIDRGSAYAEAGANLILVSGRLAAPDFHVLAVESRARTPFALECDEGVEPGQTGGVIMVCQPMRLQNELQAAARSLLSPPGVTHAAVRSKKPLPSA